MTRADRCCADGGGGCIFAERAEDCSFHRSDRTDLQSRDCGARRNGMRSGKTASTSSVWPCLLNGLCHSVPGSWSRLPTRRRHSV